MSDQKDKKELEKKAQEKKVSSPIKMRQDTIPVIVVNGVYYPTQKLRFKLNDPQYSLQSFTEKHFGIVSRKSDTDDSYYMVGTLVRVIDQETFFTNLFARNYVEFLVEGIQKFKIQKVLSTQTSQLLLSCEVQIYDEENSEFDLSMKESDSVKQLKQRSIDLCEMPRVGLSSTLNAKKKAIELRYITSPSRLSYMASSLLTNQTRIVKQSLLEIEDLPKRIELVNDLLKQEIEVIIYYLIIVQQIKKTNSDLEKSGSTTTIQRQYSPGTNFPMNFRRPGMDAQGNEEIDKLKKKIEDLQLPDEAKRIVDQEIQKLSRLSPQNSEYHVSLNYLQTISDLPWNLSEPEHLDPQKAKEVLERDHYGLDLVKKRIIQFLAVRKLKKNNKGTILCFFGPPGVGKTSLGKSIAEALGRKFYRIALGGVRDEAEIRGHRRTYIGSMPGVIIQSLIKIKSNNPVFLLDEIDKLSRDARGDPGSAMLEVLDPNQNDKFSDHFLGTPFDLSKVMFIATANSLDTIHPALLDRMEVIDITGYSIEEKLEITKKYLVPKQIKENGITEDLIEFNDELIVQVISEYTMESGVRNLDRAIGSICRSVAYLYATCEDMTKFKKVSVTNDLIIEALGNPKFDFSLYERITRPGIAVGLAYTEVGGKALLIETAKYPGTGMMNLTGKLGEVMKESVNTSFSWIKSNASRIGILKTLRTLSVHDDDDPHAHSRELRGSELIFKQFDLHVHFPAAAIPKDGPSAGVTITCALVSLFTNRRVRSDFAMTGEMSLQGLVLPVGGIKEKCIAAHRNKITNVILPIKNKKDVDDIPKDVRKQLKIHFVSKIEEALDLALEKEIDENFLKEENTPIFRPKL